MHDVHFVELSTHVKQGVVHDIHYELDKNPTVHEIQFVLVV